MTTALHETLFDRIDFTQCDVPADQVADEAITALLDKYDSTGKSLPETRILAQQCITATNAATDIENEARLARKIERIAINGGDPTKARLGNDERIYHVTRLGPAHIAQIISRTHTLVNIAPSNRYSDPDTDLLTIYVDDPASPDYGLHVPAEAPVQIIARQLNKNITTTEMKEVMFHLRVEAPRRERDTCRDWVPVNNGIVDYRTKELLPFTPDAIFTSKSQVNYNPHAQNPVYHNADDNTDWDVESWMREVAGSDELAEVIWQTIGATLRPYVRWNKSAWFYSESGNNGKGSVIELARQLLGSRAYASIPLNDFSKEFALEPLTQASAILVDENDVGTFIDKAANLKAIITGDVISINRKFRTPISYQFHGFMIQCLNEFPKIKDKSESFYRRQLFIPFTKCFTGAERKYIKNDYLRRTELLEYVLWRLINMDDYYEFNQVEETQIALNEYKSFNDPVRAFWSDHGEDFTWDLLPYGFAYDCYKKWMAETMPSSQPLGRNTFIKDISAACAKQPGEILDKYLDGTLTLDQTAAHFVALGSQEKMPSAGLMAHSEPLIEQYDLTETWGNTAFPAGSDQRNIPNPKRYYAGLVRAHAWLVHYLGQAQIDHIEQVRDTRENAAFALDINTMTVHETAPTTQPQTTQPAAPVVLSDTANTPDTPQWAPSPVTPRVKPQLTVVPTQPADDDDDDTDTFDPDRDLDVNFKPVNQADDTTAPTSIPTAPGRTTGAGAPVKKARAQRSNANTAAQTTDDTDEKKNLPWDHPDHPLNDPARQVSPTNPPVPVAEFVPQAAPTASETSGEDLADNATPQTDNTDKDPDHDDTDADTDH